MQYAKFNINVEKAVPRRKFMDSNNYVKNEEKV